ncbi:winged helix-turn-helix domain-containing protein [Bradyrhizobium sp. URHC0002]
MSDEMAENENPDLGWPKHDRTTAPETGLFVSDTELYRRLGVGPKTGRIAVQALARAGFPPKQPLFGNKRYWPAVRFFLDRYYGLIDGRAAVPAAADRRRAPQDRGR